MPTLQAVLNLPELAPYAEVPYGIWTPPVKLLRLPIEFSYGRASVRRPHAMPGEHADEILHEVGLSDEEIARLRAQGAV
jgi:crotonobetainyl-CoA:carnitine CoA-transferase CaiB-like acyl-CoA transferase